MFYFARILSLFVGPQSSHRRYATGSMLDEGEFKDLFAQWVPIASALFIKGNVGVEVSSSSTLLAAKCA